MVNRIVLGTKNRGKIKEIKAILGDLPVEILPLDRYSHLPEIEEDGSSFFENALKKAKIISEQTQEIVIADDSGLEVSFLNGEPGIHSARYAGKNATDEENIAKLLANLRGVPQQDRGAAFRCVIVLYEPDGQYHCFEGRWTGYINEKSLGNAGFGYDPVFYLKDLDLTAAQLEPGKKNQLSHRAQALKELKKYLLKHKGMIARMTDGA